MTSYGQIKLREIKRPEAGQLRAALELWLMTPRCDICHRPSAVLVRIQYPDEAAAHYCMTCRPYHFTVIDVTPEGGIGDV